MNPAKRYFSYFRDEWLSNGKCEDWVVKGKDELSGFLQNCSGKQEITGICKKLK